MRLLYFIPLLSTYGGQERTLTDKANWLADHGHEVMFVTYEHEGPLAYRLQQKVRHEDIACHYFRLYRYPLWRRPFELLRLKRAFRKKMRRVMDDFQPDVIVVPVPNTENFVWDVRRIAAHIPIVVESHLAYGHAVIKRGWTERWLYHFQDPFKAVCKADLLIALTEGDAKCWRTYINKVCVIPNPLTCYPPQLTGVKQDHRIIAVGRLTAQKRFDRLIDAFALIAASHPQWYVDIYGGGEDSETLIRQIAGRGLEERIRILPPTPDIYSQYQSSQFFVMSSDFEGFGLVIIEAMACGIPVVASDCPYGPSEIIADGQTGLLAKTDVEDLADKMEWMMTHDAERQQMGLHAYQTAARYSLDYVMPEWEQAYLSVHQ